MKIAIQGHPTRGKEVAQILESLGGKNSADYRFTYNNLIYYLDSDNLIIGALVPPSGYREYTLEEFEKEFPFKVGDLCIYQSEYFGDIKVKVLRMIIQDNDIVYEIGPKDTDETYSGIYRKRDVLKPHKEMKEERNITLTLEKAKEWYKKGGELKEIALQAFTEKELISLPRSWEEFCKQGNLIASWRYHIPTKYEALFKLEQLRACWRQGWIPSKGDVGFGIRFDLYDGFKIIKLYATSTFLSFPTEEIAKEFLKCFRDLIEKAGDLI